MNASTHTMIHALRAQGKSAAEVSELLATDFRTVRNLDRKLLAAYLLTAGLFERLDAVRVNEAVPVELRIGLNKLFFTLQSGIDYLGTHDSSDVASQGELLLSGLAQVGTLTQEEKDAILALGGGYLLERLTAEEVRAYWEEYDAQETAAAAEAAVRQALADGYNAAVAAVDLGERNLDALKQIWLEALES